MRDTKFRGLTINGDLVIGNISIIKKPLIGMHSVGIGTYISNDAGMPFAYEVRPETVGQSAELDNINLYEGDRFHLGDPNITYVVEWFDCGLKGRQEGNMSSVGLVHWKRQIEIIGNIHQKL